MLPNTDENLFHELSFYTLAHPSSEFIHQYIVDAYGAQAANENTKEIRVIFSLVGLYLSLEKGYTGREVQLFHMKMAKDKIVWPKIELPVDRGSIFVKDVVAIKEREDRDKKIVEWSQDVWNSYQKQRQVIIQLAEYYL